MAKNNEDLEVDIRPEKAKAIIAGKTAIPFKTFVGLVLQRKVLNLFKRWGDAPVIISSEMLTDLASAPQDSQENRAQVILVTLGTGILAGIFLLAVVQLILVNVGFVFGQREFLLIAGLLVLLAAIVVILSKVQRKNRAQKIADTMEKVANLLGK